MKNSDFEKSRADAKVLWRFSDLKALGIVEDRATGRRWMDTEGFPQPIILGPNSLAWDAEEVRQWVKSRPRGAAPQPPRAKAA